MTESHPRNSLSTTPEGLQTSQPTPWASLHRNPPGSFLACPILCCFIAVAVLKYRQARRENQGLSGSQFQPVVVGKSKQEPETSGHTHSQEQRDECLLGAQCPLHTHTGPRLGGPCSSQQTPGPARSPPCLARTPHGALDRQADDENQPSHPTGPLLGPALTPDTSGFLGSLLIFALSTTLTPQGMHVKTRLQCSSF